MQNLIGTEYCVPDTLLPVSPSRDAAMINGYLGNQPHPSYLTAVPLVALSVFCKLDSLFNFESTSPPPVLLSTMELRTS